MHPILGTVDGFVVRSFPAIALVAFFVATRYLAPLARARGLGGVRFDLFCFGILWSGVVGGRLGYLLFERPDLLLRWEALRAWHGGMLSFGGYAGVLGFAVVMLWRARVPVAPLVDAVLEAGMLFQAIARWGCFAAGDDYGAPSQLPWAMRFTDPAAALPPALRGVPLHPTQLYLSLAALMTFLAARRVRRAGAPTGVVSAVVVIGYAVTRLVVEPWRGDPEPTAGGVRLATLLCVAAIACAGAWLGWRLARRRALVGPATLALVVGAALVPARPAAAYVLRRNDHGRELRWSAAHVALRLSQPIAPDWTAARAGAALAAATDAWNEPLAGSGAPSLTWDPTLSTADVGLDHENVVVWRLAGFCDDPDNAADNLCQAPAATAVTVLSFVDDPNAANDGEILDADIELNAAAYDFTDSGAPGAMDLQNTLTHELGHLLGLSHTCNDGQNGASLWDGTNQPIPTCDSNAGSAPAITQVTMYNFITADEVSKRTPKPDDLDGARALYLGVRHGCSAAPGGAPSSAMSLPLGLLALGWWSARRRRRA